MRQRKPTVRLTPELYARIKADLDEGLTVKQIASKRGVCTKTIYRVDHRETAPRLSQEAQRLKLYKPGCYAPRALPVRDDNSGRSYEIFPRKFA